MSKLNFLYLTIEDWAITLLFRVKVRSGHLISTPSKLAVDRDRD
ncbi:hypothetical protein [Microcoleus sp. FACHB-SPT15]|nr:hypothetical protein [Microcoleus sp. FACHB-SPT15]